MKVKHYDIVIIGSGAGGGTIAQALAPMCKSGARIALLEAGNRFSAQDNTGRELEMASKYYYDGGGFLTQQGDMTLAFAKAVGGSTTVYTGTSLIAPEHVIEGWQVPGLTHADLRPRYQRYIQENNVHLLPEDELNDNNRLFREGCARLSYRCDQFPVNIKGCKGTGKCNLGCPNLAKQGTAVVQIPNAQAHGVEVVTCCTVDRIGEQKVYARVTPPEHDLAPSVWETGSYEISAQTVVLCAGAVHSPYVLLKSGYKLPMLGKYFTCHPALILVAQHERPIRGIAGHPKSFYCDEFMARDRFLLETCMYFPFTTAKNLAGFGKESADLIERFDHLQMILALAIDDEEEHNCVKITRDGRPQVSYTFSERTIHSLIAAMRAAARIFFASGATRVHAPACDTFFIERKDADFIDRLIHRKAFQLGRISISAAHLMGGCRMGTDEVDSVTDGWGNVHGAPWLFVADASLFPKCSQINPYLTIMALADRVAERVRKRYGEGS